MPGFLQAIANLPPLLIYLVIGVGAAIENFIPPIPADTFVLLGAFISAEGRVNPWLVFLVTWVFNVAAAVAVYGLTWKYGQRFFQTKVGHFLLHPRQLRQIERFYARWGVPAILFSRFLPAFRAAVPVFAGVTHVPLRRVLPPMAIASAAWYGTLVYLGAAVGRNWEELMRFFDRFNKILIPVAAVLLVAVAVWWWKSRREEEEEVTP
jgi:membrane protein DedA with SNARE-associated domain